MKTSAEIAEKTAAECLHNGCPDDACIKCIAKAIDEAIVHESNASYRMGRKEAFERSAEIADQFAQDQLCWEGNKIADLIRAEADRV